MRLFTQFVACVVLASALQANQVQTNDQTQVESHTPNKYVAMAKAVTAHGATHHLSVIRADHKSGIVRQRERA
jgi:hypothetical protein